MAAYANSVWFVAGSSGTADFSDGTGINGYLNMAGGGMVNGQTYSYRAVHPTNPAIFENGRGVYNSGTGVLSRATQYETSDAGAKVDFAAAPVVAVAPLKVDFDEKISTSAIGIANDNVLTAKNTPNSGEWAKFTAAGIEGRTAAELKADLDLEVGVDLQAFDADTLKGDVADQPITGGAWVTTLDLGNLSGNTITPDPGDRPIQKITNNGAGTIAPGSNQGCYLLVVKNTTGAGAITTSGWSDVDGDAFTTATTAEFLCHCTVVGDFSSMTVKQVTA